MRRALMCVVVGIATACGGADGTNLGDGGGDANPTDGAPIDANPSDASIDVVVSCDGGTTSCGGQCVDTSSDLQNCGGCGVVCNTQCTGGVCQLIASCDASATQVGDNACLTVDATHVYWGTGFNNTGSVWSIPINGGCPTMMIGSQDRPHGMASDGTNLFYANQGSTANIGSIQRIAIGGTIATPIAIAQPSPLDIAVDAANVYWTNSGDGSVWKSDKATPNPIKLAGPNGANHAGFLRVDSTFVYFTDPAGGVVNRVPIATGATTAMTVASNGSSLGQIAIDGSNAYFGSHDATTSAILSIALNASAGTPSQLVTSLPSVNGIQTDGTHIWFAEATNVQPYQANTGELHRVTTAGTTNTPLASKQNGPNCISVDATSLYWIDTGGGMIAKTGK